MTLLTCSKYPSTSFFFLVFSLLHLANQSLRVSALHSSIRMNRQVGGELQSKFIRVWLSVLVDVMTLAPGLGIWL